MTASLAELLGLNEDTWAWREKALCAQIDVGDVFFPEKGGLTKPAKWICSRCEVVNECLQWALDRDERYGVYGGLSAKERARLLRRQPVARGPQPIRHGTEGGYTTHKRRGEDACQACLDGYAQARRRRAESARRSA